MADFGSIIGIADSVAGVTGGLEKLASTVEALRAKHDPASDIGVTDFLVRVNKLRGTLAQVRKWAEAQTECPYHQLQMAIDRSVACGKLLVNKVETELAEAQEGGPGEMMTQHDIGMRLRALFRSKVTADVQRLIVLQTRAATVVLTACGSSAEEQQKVLEKKESRKVFKKLEDDSVALVTQRDTESIKSRVSGRLRSAKRPLPIEFDREVFATRILERLHRRQARARRGSLSPSPKDARKNSRAIDKALRNEAKRGRKPVNILLLGSPTKSQIVKRLKALHPLGFSKEELAAFRPLILKGVLESAKEVVEVVASVELETAEHLKGGMDRIKQASLTPDGQLGTQVAAAIQELWGDPVVGALAKERPGLYDWAEADYFFKSADRVSAPDYLPTNKDVLKTNATATGLRHTDFEMEHFTVQVQEMDHQPTSRLKWINHFENCPAVIFVANIDEYDVAAPLHSSSSSSSSSSSVDVAVDPRSGSVSQASRLGEAMAQFESIVNSEFFGASTTVILLLHGVARFRQKVAQVPLGRHFADYEGGADVNRAARYILWRFSSVNRAGLTLYPRFVDGVDEGVGRFVYAGVKEAVLAGALRNVGGKAAF